MCYLNISKFHFDLSVVFSSIFPFEFSWLLYMLNSITYLHCWAEWVLQLFTVLLLISHWLQGMNVSPYCSSYDYLLYQVMVTSLSIQSDESLDCPLGFLWQYSTREWKRAPWFFYVEVALQSSPSDSTDAIDGVFLMTIGWR